jgi:hypothetical protein
MMWVAAMRGAMSDGRGHQQDSVAGDIWLIDERQTFTSAELAGLRRRAIDRAKSELKKELDHNPQLKGRVTLPVFWTDDCLNIPVSAARLIRVVGRDGHEAIEVRRRLQLRRWALIRDAPLSNARVCCGVPRRTAAIASGQNSPCEPRTVRRLQPM